MGILPIFLIISIFFLSTLILTISSEIVPIPQNLIYRIGVVSAIALPILYIVPQYSNNYYTLEETRSGEINNETVIKLYRKFKDNYSVIDTYFISYSLFTSIFLFAIVTSDSPFSNSKSTAIYSYIVSIALICIIRIEAYSTRREYKEFVKESINKKYRTNFPEITILTNSGQDVKGKIENVFNDDSIALNDNGMTTIVMWPSIETMRMRSRYIDSEQTQLSDIIDIQS